MREIDARIVEEVVLHPELAGVFRSTGDQ